MVPPAGTLTRIRLLYVAMSAVSFLWPPSFHLGPPLGSLLSASQTRATRRLNNNLDVHSDVLARSLLISCLSLAAL